jgi:hypothetical protein
MENQNHFVNITGMNTSRMRQAEHVPLKAEIRYACKILVRRDYFRDRRIISKMSVESLGMKI